MCNISIKSTHRPKVTKVLRVQGMQRHVISHTYAGAAGSWHEARKGVESIVLHFQANQYEETAFTQNLKQIAGLSVYQKSARMPMDSMIHSSEPGIGPR